ncbi:hypothetical protein CAEBREN_00584 [Caenorhabditis brenneri]|uniref:ATP-dependent DNA helicase n=1 Tax=Caenorhabditis brenneri TaxID=135651 RepID=G0N2U2_CAEBE|nr:hypothetical protein CAEBREN_00584 [Caenorhabditis brenneri]
MSVLSLLLGKKQQQPLVVSKMPVQVDGVVLAGEQLQVYERFLEEHRQGKKILWSVLGLSGTGKTTLLKAIQNAPRSEHGGPNCLSTAYVATAAVQIEAKTINSTFLLSRDGEPYNANQIACDRMYQELRACDVLLIDNVNYVDANTFVNINRRLQEAHRNQEAFGGISVILFGDLFQQSRYGESIYGANAESQVLWQMFKSIELTHNFKYESEEERHVMNAIAMGGLYLEAKEYLTRHCRMDGGNPQKVATKLLELRAEYGDQGEKFAVIAPSNEMVGDIQERLIAQAIHKQTFPRVNQVPDITGREDQFSHQSEKTDIAVTVARGCTVMLTINLPISIGNTKILHGTTGVVEGWDADTIHVRFDDHEDTEKITRVGWYYKKEGTNIREGWEQFPLLVTNGVYNYQNSQGLLFDGVIVVRETSWGSGARALDAGDFYSALSRAKSLKKSCITPTIPLKWTRSGAANQEMARLRNAQNQE